MLVEHDPSRPGDATQAAPEQSWPGARHDSALRRFLGGSPASVFLRLVFLSVLVGAFMSMLGVTPGLLFWRILDSARTLLHLVGAQLHDLTGWVIAGAVVVVPLWLIARLVAVSR